MPEPFAALGCNEVVTSKVEAAIGEQTRKSRNVGVDV